MGEGARDGHAVAGAEVPPPPPTPAERTQRVETQAARAWRQRLDRIAEERRLIEAARVRAEAEAVAQAQARAAAMREAIADSIARYGMWFPSDPIPSGDYWERPRTWRQWVADVIWRGGG